MMALGGAAESRVGASTRVAQLRRESSDHATPARSSSCYSDPEVVRCCSGTAAAAAVPRVAALRRHFRRRKAITLADFDVQHRFSRLSESAARESIRRFRLRSRLRSRLMRSRLSTREYQPEICCHATKVVVLTY